MRIFLFLALLGAAAAQEPKPCPFCEIIAGTRQQEGIVCRDDKVVAFLSIGPRNCSCRCPVGTHASHPSA